MFCRCYQARSRAPLDTWQILLYRYTPQGQSRVFCRKCKRAWRARAAYVEQIKQTNKNLFNE